MNGPQILPLDRVAAVIGDQAFGSLGARELRVLIVLLACGGMDGIAWPAVPRIAELARVDERHARRALKELVRIGVLELVSAPSGRRSRRFRVAPAARPGELSALFAERAESARDSEAPEGADSARSNDDREGADSARSRSVEGAISGCRGGRTSPPKAETLSTLPTPSSTRTSGDPSLAAAAAPVSGSLDDRVAAAIAARDAMLDRAARARAAHSNPFVGRARLDSAIGLGMTVEDFDALLARARSAGHQPAGLLWHWLGDESGARWRGVLADAALERRESRARVAPSARPGSVPTHVGECEPIRLAIGE